VCYSDVALCSGYGVRFVYMMLRVGGGEESRMEEVFILQAFVLVLYVVVGGYTSVDTFRDTLCIRELTII
jgi:hypothetical protein